MYTWLDKCKAGDLRLQFNGKMHVCCCGSLKDKSEQCISGKALSFRYFIKGKQCFDYNSFLV